MSEVNETACCVYGSPRPASDHYALRTFADKVGRSGPLASSPPISSELRAEFPWVTTSTTMKIACRIVFLLAGLLAVISLVLGYRSASLLLGGSKAEGEVVRMEPAAGSSGAYDLDVPIIRYGAPGGRLLEGRGPSEQYSPFGVGDRVTVYFDQRDPTRMQVATFAGLWTAPLAVLAIALMLAGTGLVMRASERRASTTSMVGGVFAIIGVPLLLAGLGEAADRAQLLQHGWRARGTVLNGEAKRGSCSSRAGRVPKYRPKSASLPPMRARSSSSPRA